MRDILTSILLLLASQKRRIPNDLNDITPSESPSSNQSPPQPFLTPNSHPVLTSLKGDVPVTSNSVTCIAKGKN